jgi:hypothetical protein
VLTAELQVDRAQFGMTWSPLHACRQLTRLRRNVPAMSNAHAGAWHYTARYGWNWRSARAVSAALGSLALPMPPWLRMVVARCLTTRTALHADAEGIWGSAGPLSPGPAGPCPWQDVTDIVVWNYEHLRIIGLARRGEAVGGGPAARVVATRTPQQSRPTRRRAFRRHPAYPAFIAPDGSPYEIGNVVTTNGWCVDPARLQATVRHFAPRARFVDLSVVTAPESGGPIEYAFEVLAGLIELIGWRRLGWLLGVAASAAVLAVAAANLGRQSLAPAGVTVGALGLALFIWRAVAVRRHRRRFAHPEAWLESGREDAESSPLARLRRGRLAAWTLRHIPFARWRRRQVTRASRRRPPYAIRRGR